MEIGGREEGDFGLLPEEKSGRELLGCVCVQKLACGECENSQKGKTRCGELGTGGNTENEESIPRCLPAFRENGAKRKD